MRIIWSPAGNLQFAADPDENEAFRDIVSIFVNINQAISLCYKWNTQVLTFAFQN